MCQPKSRSSSSTALIASVTPFLQLARVDRPAGSIQIFYPYLYGLLFAYLTTDNDTPPLSDIFGFRIPLLLLSASLLRSYGCVWNDICDVEIDRQVERTKSRPLARGALSIPAAYTYLAGLIAAWIITLVPLLSEPKLLSTYGAPLFVLVMAYPFGKRVTSYAQVVLGVTVGWGVIFGAAMAGIDTLGSIMAAVKAAAQTRDANVLVTSLNEPMVLGLLSLYATNLVWTVLYDTIYAFQDIADDRKVGVKSLAIRIESVAKPFLWLLAFVQAALLGYTKTLIKHNGQGSLVRAASVRWPVHARLLERIAHSACIYDVFAIQAGTACLAAMIIRVDLESPRSCAWWFKNGSTLVSSMIGLGLVGQYLVTA